ncbi:MAG: hypothetical protein HY651_09615 [Acidobacteria bacterium]|nr:hypothetical protein [Acidobacteriota bacterium]
MFCSRALGLIAGLVVLFNAGCSGGTQQSEQKETVSAAQITPEDIELAGVRLFRDDAGYQVEGQIQNNSPQFTLKEFQFKMVMQDCLDTGVCEILAEDVNTIATNVPAGQSAAFQATPNFSNMPAPKGRLGWHYAVATTTGFTP